MLESLWPTISERLWRLTLTEVSLLLILAAICVYGGRILNQLRRTNHHLRALRNDEDRLLARTERELLSLNLERRREALAQNAQRRSYAEYFPGQEEEAGARTSPT